MSISVSPPACFNRELVFAIAKAKEFLLLERALRADHEWTRICHTHRNVRQYLLRNKQLSSVMMRVQLATVAAQTYADFGGTLQDIISYPTSAEAKVIKSKADGLAKSIEYAQWLPPEAKTPTFSAGLKALSNVYPCKRIRGENRKGNPERRAFILRLAENFYRSFRSIPVAVITDLISIGFPDIPDRSVRLVLPNEKTREIAEKVDAEMRSENSANTDMLNVVNRLTRRGLLTQGEDGQLKRQEAINDDEKFRMAITYLKGLADQEVATAAIVAITEIAVEFGINLTPPSETSESGSEIFDL